MPQYLKEKSSPPVLNFSWLLKCRLKKYFKKQFWNTFHGHLVAISTETEKWIRRILEIKFSKYFCISMMLLTQIMGKSCGPYEFICLRGKCISGTPYLRESYFVQSFEMSTYWQDLTFFFDATRIIYYYFSAQSNNTIIKIL